MALIVTLTPGGTVAVSGEEVTPAKLNQLGSPTFTITGTVQTSDIAAGAVTSAKVQAGNYFYAGTGGSSTAYTLDLGSGLRPSSLTDGIVVHAKIHTACGVAPTLNVTGSGGSGLGAKELRLPADLAVKANDFLANQTVTFIYNSSADGGSGAWVAQSPPATHPPVVVADSRNLICKNNAATPNTKLDITADSVLLVTTSDQPYLATDVSLTIDTGAANGANALDSGSLSQGWYYAFVIYNPTTDTVAGLLSASATEPTMPSSEYTFKALVSSMRVQGSAFLKFWQTQRRVHLGRTGNSPVLDGYSGGGVDTWLALSAGSSVPPSRYISPIAKTAFGVMGCTGSSTSEPRLGVAGDGTELYGMQLCVGSTSQAGTGQDSFKGACNFEVPIITSQDFYWTGPASAINRMVISGYTI